MRVRVVEKYELPRIAREPWVDPERRCHVRGGRAYVPVRDGFASEMELEERQPYGSRGYYMVGDIAVVHGKRPDHRDLDAIIRWKKPRGVVWTGPPEGIMRVPQTTVLYGSAGETVHREGGLLYHLDPGEVMFAMGNRGEKERLASLVSPGERVADMCAGIGYFTLPMARAGADVEASEINPASFRFLLRNITSNHLGSHVSARCGDSRNHLKGVYDRVVVGHFESPAFIPSLAGHLAPGSTVHCHTLSDFPGNLEDEFSMMGHRVRTTRHRVKKFRPHVWHEVHDCEVIA
jgi:tRNA wybutosine-synthesizing protein 2